MDNQIEKKLSEMSTTKLIKIIQAALTTMSESEQIDFIAKHIDARTSLNRLGSNDPVAFMDEVEAFCMSCLNCEYYSDEDDMEAYFSRNRYDAHYYNDEWDYDEFYSNTEWARTFAHLFRLSMMYIQSGDFETGYEATARLLSCLKEMMGNECFLGTNEPMSYISIDWNDLFALHYEALFEFHTEPDRAIKFAFNRWLDFGSYCNEGFLNNVKDASIAKRYILNDIMASKVWVHQRKCFELLTGLYIRLNEPFDKAAEASLLINYNSYFFLMVVEGLCEKECWHDSISVACDALAQIKPADGSGDQKGVRAAIQSKLTDAYEMLLDFENAFKTAKIMFQESPSFVLYKRARALSEKTGDTRSLLVFAEGGLSKNGQSFSFSHSNLLRDIYSYEGESLKLMDMAKSQKINTNYYDRKYIALSLVYRATNNISSIGDNLAEYLVSAANQDGIADMLLFDNDDLRRVDLLLNGADLLRGIISFHIGAATRSRYAKAAYYMCVIRDIFIYLKQEDDFKRYFQEVIQQNSRRPALRDEMSIVYGKAAIVIKK